eukprot:scaffold3339_cov174-Amphora_coffeaeformis.AAC.17
MFPTSRAMPFCTFVQGRIVHFGLHGNVTSKRRPASAGIEFGPCTRLGSASPRDREKQISFPRIV